MKLTNEKYYKFVGWTIFLIVFFLAYQDTTGLQMFDQVGGYGTDFHNKINNLYMELFWTFASVLIGAVAAAFYYFRRDISESIAIFIGSWIVLFGGAEDVVYYWILGRPGLDASMPWLYNITIGWTSKYILGLDTVTPLGLYLQLGLSIVVAIIVVRWLRGYNKKIGGIKI